MDDAVASFRKALSSNYFYAEAYKGLSQIVQYTEIDDEVLTMEALYGRDDVTDEDAFIELSDKGIGILVGYNGRPTAARYTLKNVYQVQLFIEMLMKKAYDNE